MNQFGVEEKYSTVVYHFKYIIPKTHLVIHIENKPGRSGCIGCSKALNECWLCTQNVY